MRYSHEVKRLARASACRTERAGLGKIRPHAFRRSFTTAVLDASGDDLQVARDRGWASTAVIDEIYAPVDVRSRRSGR